MAVTRTGDGEAGGGTFSLAGSLTTPSPADGRIKQGNVLLNKAPGINAMAVVGNSGMTVGDDINDQVLTFNNTTGGSFTLTYGGMTTGPISFNSN